MTNLEKFKKNVKPRKRVSKLNKYRDEIEELLVDRYTHQQICEYLQSSYNIEVSRQYLSNYIQISIKQNIPKKANFQSQKEKPTSAKDAIQALDNFFGTNS